MKRSQRSEGRPQGKEISHGKLTTHEPGVLAAEKRRPWPGSEIRVEASREAERATAWGRPLPHCQHHVARAQPHEESSQITTDMFHLVINYHLNFTVVSL
jgi:hypothetical protein